MIGKLSSQIVRKLIDLSIIADADQELYIYGFFVLLSHIMYCIITLILGAILGVILESAVFYLAFQFIRRYAGGVHASSELKCEISTTISIMICLLGIIICETYNLQTAILIPTVAAALCILFLCPLDTPEKPLSEEETRYFRKISWIILLVILVVISVTRYFNIEILMYPCCMSIILESILLVLGKIKKAINQSKQQ